MMSPFICGSFSSQEDEYELDELLSPCSTPKRSRKSSGRDNKNNNPYADRGLDKFSALLAELENKKQKIYTQKGSEDISLVRFVYSGSNNWRPIVVKSKDRKQDHHNSISSSSAVNHVNKGKDQQPQQNKQSPEAAPEKQLQSKEELLSGSLKLGGLFEELMKNLRNPTYHLPLAMLLILLLLVVYGRSFAILCTSLGWYLVPMIKERSSTSTVSDKTKNKKDYTRRLSEKSLASGSNNIVDHHHRSSSPSSSPKSVLNGPGGKPTTGRHSHKKSW